MKKAVSEILKNKNINSNLKLYAEQFMEANNKYASVRLAMNYYTYYTMISEDGMMQTENMSVLAILNQVIENYSNGEKNANKNIDKLEKIRNEIIEQVSDITCYIDRLSIYEHALNRVEYRFKEASLPDTYSDEAMTRTLMQFIVAEEDNATVNNKIRLVLGQLPIRFTKRKFYEMVSNGLSIYKGIERENLNDFLYMLRTVSMLETTNTMAINYPHLKEVMDKLETVSFKTITSEQYEEMSYNISKSSEYIDEVMNIDMMLQEIINDLLIVLLTENYCQEDNIIKACKEIIKDTNLMFLNKISPKSIEEIEDMFVMLEGVQEELYPKLSVNDITEQIKESYAQTIEELGLKDMYNTVYKLPALNADSLFVQVDKEADTTIVDEKILEQEEEKLFSLYAELFAKNDKMINRAVMATVIAELPIFFNNISELQDFIYNTLSICTDKAEKLACIEILNEIMES